MKSAEKKGEIATKFIPAPSKFDIKDKNKNFTYVLMAEVLPTKMFHIYRSNDYNYHDEDKNKEPNRKSDDNNDNDSTSLVIIIVIVVILVVIILIATIFVIRAFRKKDSENIDSQVKDKSLGEGISNPLPQSDFFISEGDRLFGENFATGEYYRRKAENEKKKERYKIRQNQTMERERRRWERIDYEYLRRENQNMVNKEKNLVGRKNNPGMAFNPLNLQYDNSVQGEILKRRDEES